MLTDMQIRSLANARVKLRENGFTEEQVTSLLAARIESASREKMAEAIVSLAKVLDRKKF